MNMWGVWQLAGGILGCFILASAQADSASIRPSADTPISSINSAQALPVELEPAQAVVQFPREVQPGLQDAQVKVDRFEVQGLSAAQRTEVLGLLADLQGQVLDFEGLTQAVDRVNRYVQGTLGWYLGYAYLPSQNTRTGTVRIQVNPGVLEQVELRWNPALRVSRTQVEALLNQLPRGQVVRTAEVESLALMLNDVRGLQAELSVQPGRMPGGVVLLVKVNPDQVPWLRMSLDQWGAQSTGRNRLHSLVQQDNLLGLGDQWLVAHSRSFGGELEASSVQVTVPWGLVGPTVGLNVTHSSLQLPNSANAQGQVGDFTAWKAFVNHKALRTRNHTVQVAGSLDWRRLSTLPSDVYRDNRELQVQAVSATGDHRDAWAGGGLSTWALELRSGQLDRSVPVISGHSTQLQASATRLQTWVPRQWLLYGSLRAQLTTHALDPSLQCSLGGPSGVKGYGLGLPLADECVSTSAELRFVLPKRWLGAWVGQGITVGAYWDKGWARRNSTAAPGSDFRQAIHLDTLGVRAVWVHSKQVSAELLVSEQVGDRSPWLDSEHSKVLGAVRWAF